MTVAATRHELDVLLQAEREVVGLVLSDPLKWIPVLEPILNGGEALTGGIRPRVYREAVAQGPEASDASISLALLQGKDEERRTELAGELHALRQACGEFLHWPTGNVRAKALTLAKVARRVKLRGRAIELAQAIEKGNEDEALDSFLEEVPDLVKTPGGEELAYLDLEGMAREGIPPMPWLFPAWLAEKDLALVAGHGGSGKSTLAGALLFSLASGRPWLGMEPTKTGHVLYVDEEQGPEELARLLIRLGAPHPNIRAVSMLGVQLSRADGLQTLRALIEDWRPILTVLDSVSQVFGVEDEAKPEETSAIYRKLFGLRDEFETSFLLIHHARKSAPGGAKVPEIELARGTSAHASQPSTVWTARPASGTALDLRQAKRRGGGTRKAIRIAYSEDGPDGAITLSAEDLDEIDSDLAKASEWLIEFVGERPGVTKAEIRTAAEGAGLKDRTLERALSHLVKIKFLERPARGRYQVSGGGLAGREPGADPELEEGPDEAVAGTQEGIPF